MSLRQSALTILAVLILALPAQAQDTDFDVWIDDVQLRPGITIDLHAKVYVNEEHPCDDKTIVFLPGMTAAHFNVEGFAEAIFADNPSGRKVCRVAVIDLPGHPGPPFLGSGVPEGDLLLGEVTIQDHAAAYLAALEGLSEVGVHPKTLMGHSMGGLVIQLAQQKLVDEGTDLRKAFNTKKVVLAGSMRAAPVPYPEAVGVQWVFDLLYNGFISYDDVDVLMFPFTFHWDCDEWTSPVGIPPLPPPVDCDPSSGLGDLVYYFGSPTFREPFTAAAQGLGVAQYERPVVEAGIFAPAHGTELWVVSFEHDTYQQPVNTPPLYQHLTGGSALDGYFEVLGPNAGHGMVINYPEEFLEAIAGVIELP